MYTWAVHAPFSLLLSTELATSAKIIWMTLRADVRVKPRLRSSPTRLEKRTGLTRPTVRKALAQLKAGQWYVNDQCCIPLQSTVGTGRRGGILHAYIPLKLLFDQEIGIQAKVMFGVLQATRGYWRPSGQFTYAYLKEMTDCDLKTIRAAIGELVDAGWIVTSQENQMAPIYFTLSDPDTTRTNACIADINQQLAQAQCKERVLMRAYLSLIVDSDDYRDDASLDIVINPDTGERLSVDRLYRQEIAFDFQYTRQESVAPEKAEHAALSGTRSKAEICQAGGIRLIEVYPEDLTLQAMRQKVGKLLPIRNMRGYGNMIKYLEVLSAPYSKAGWQTQTEPEQTRFPTSPAQE